MHIKTCVKFIYIDFFFFSIYYIGELTKQVQINVNQKTGACAPLFFILGSFYNLLYLVETPFALSTGYFLSVLSIFRFMISMISTPSTIDIWMQ